MTYNKIIKALECLCGCALKCRECPYSPRYPFPSCQRQVAKDTLALVTRQQAKIDDLMERTSVTTLIDDAVVYTPTLEDYNKFKKKFKSEAVKEFADKVVCDIDTYCEKNIKTKPFVSGVTGMQIAHNLVYKRLKEMVGENNA